MSKWKSGKLRSGSKKGAKVPKGKAGQKQAVAIMLSEKRKEAKHGGHYPEKKGKKSGSKSGSKRRNPHRGKIVNATGFSH